MTLRRGFKAEAEQLAIEVRDELGLTPYARLDPLEFAKYLEIPIRALSELAPTSAGARHLLTEERDAFSAMTVFDDHRRVIVHNDHHSLARQNSNLTHELAHGLLHHPPSPALDNITRCRIFNSTNEEEASWLTGELLVTRPMTLAIARGQIGEDEAARLLAVSRPMLRWRINMTGARRRVLHKRKPNQQL